MPTFLHDKDAKAQTVRPGDEDRPDTEAESHESVSAGCSHPVSRRDFVRNCAAGGLALALTPVLNWRGGAERTSPERGPASWITRLEQNWLFGGRLDPAAIAKASADGFSRITLPHCVSKLSWQGWDPATWQGVWMYRRPFALPERLGGLRIFLHFDGVMVGTTPTINGHELAKHLGGYLPFRYEITEWVKPAGNLLAVAVDSRWSNVPPEGAPIGPQRIDYLEAGGIYRSVYLKAVPLIFISDVFAKPVRVLESTREVEVVCRLDAAVPLAKGVELQIELKDGASVIAHARAVVHVENVGETTVRLTLSHLGNVALWDVDAPRLYDVVATLFVGGKPVHDYRVRVGFRDARFEVDGFFLNGRRLQLFGLNRHETYPFVGGAMPPRVLRRDAEMLRRDFNCNIVRCSHYPQSEAFLDACDELGLMAWEEIPGWGYLGDEAWKELLVRDVADMVVRDRNHPAIVIWGVRVNESANDVPLYQRTTAVARSLDDSRPTSGSMTADSRRNWTETWHQDVFAYDDYHAASDGSVGIDDPVPGVPYMLAEAVGQFNYRRGKDFNNKYRRAGDVKLQQLQAIYHVQAHSKAAANPRNCGVIAWCAFDYASLINSHNAVKTPGIADVFRIPKLGASFYLAQADPQIRPAIQPNFYWDFGPQTPQGPGKRAAVFSNCDRLELYINGQHHSTLQPDSVHFPHSRHAPFFADLEMDGATHPELRIDGYLGTALVLSRRFSSESAHDRLVLKADDEALVGDGVDATRVVFRVVDEFGADRAFATGVVTFEVTGPGTIVGDNPFWLADSGGVGAIWIKTAPNSAGRIVVTARHSALGEGSVAIDVAATNNATHV